MWAQQDSIRIADSLRRTLIVVDTIDETLQDSLVISEEKIVIEEDTKNEYYLIVGAYGNPDNAKAIARQFRDKGYETSIILRTNNSGNNLDMVSVNTFTNYEEALNYRNEFRSKVNPSAWLYHSN